MATDDKKVGRILARYRKALENRQFWDSTWIQLDKFYRGEQYNDSAMPPWIPKSVTNYVHLTVTTKRAALSTENLTGMLSATSLDDVESIDELQMIYEWVWKKIKVDKIIRQNIETSKLLGTAIAHVCWDEKTGVMGGSGAYYEGEIKIKEIDPLNTAA